MQQNDDRLNSLMDAAFLGGTMEPMFDRLTRPEIVALCSASRASRETCKGRPPALWSALYERDCLGSRVPKNKESAFLSYVQCRPEPIFTLTYGADGDVEAAKRYIDAASLQSQRACAVWYYVAGWNRRTGADLQQLDGLEAELEYITRWRETNPLDYTECNFDTIERTLVGGKSEAEQFRRTVFALFLGAAKRAYDQANYARLTSLLGPLSYHGARLLAITNTDAVSMLTAAGFSASSLAAAYNGALFAANFGSVFGPFYRTHGAAALALAAAAFAIYKKKDMWANDKQLEDDREQRAESSRRRGAILPRDL